MIVNYQEKAKLEGYKESVLPAQAQAHENFFSQYYNESEPLYTNSDVENYCQDCLDGVVVGSDAVFRMIPRNDPLNIVKRLLGKKIQLPETNGDLPAYWLDWPSSGRRVARFSVAASSMGTMFFFLPKGTRRKMGASAKRFDVVTVRDDWTRWMLRHVTAGEVDAGICPDPVFSLGANFQIPKECYPRENLSDVILISGAMSVGWVERFIQEARNNGFRVAGLPGPADQFRYKTADFNIELPLSPLQWYCLLASCGGYVGTRFHALVVCVANGVPFVTVDNHPRSLFLRSSSKMYDLCKRATATERYFSLRFLARKSANEIWSALRDPWSLERADRYGHKAAFDFGAVISHIRDVFQ
jgi:hypothetical protein